MKRIVFAICLAMALAGPAFTQAKPISAPLGNGHWLTIVNFRPRVSANIVDE